MTARPPTTILVLDLPLKNSDLAPLDQDLHVLGIVMPRPVSSASRAAQHCEVGELSETLPPDSARAWRPAQEDA
jgi:hypothetical protein